jgi:PhnB protein
MKGTNTYLVFDGNCRQAMEFYGKCLGVKVDVMSFGDAPAQPGCEMPVDAKDRVMHANLKIGTTDLMASDTMPGMPFQQGNNFSINIQCETADEIDRLFNAFSQKGNVVMPLNETFWAKRFGMLIDQFGVGWMFNLEKPMPADFGKQARKQEPVNA